VHHTDDLLRFCSARGHPSYRKVSVCDGLPRARGVYLFKDAGSRVLYVGKATDLRSRVRSYFGDERRRIDDMLRAMESVDHIVCATDLDASVLEARLIRAHAPPFNRAQRGRATQWFLKLTEERFPRLSATRTPGTGLGPMPSGVSGSVKDALEEVIDIRTCTMRITRATSRPPCVRGQIGHCPAPCTGSSEPRAYEPIVASLRRALDGDASEILLRLADRIDRLAAGERFEHAAATRDRLGALVEALRTARAVRALVEAGSLSVRVGDSVIELCGGRAVRADGHELASPPDDHPDEPRLIAAWLARNRARVRIESCDGAFAHPVSGGRVLSDWHERLRRVAALT
ncbi:MAG: GIY-YIG nuclease family protein, partial [Actinobacteria bacterium]|nr:GIY-YIG nuclease family protein [Actinomycetota bacterium]